MRVTSCYLVQVDGLVDNRVTSANILVNKYYFLGFDDLAVDCLAISYYLLTINPTVAGPCILLVYLVADPSRP